MRIFVFVARLNSFTGAAKALNLTLPTVSRSITRLEAHLNAVLLIRTTRRISLTGAGLDFFHKCSKILIGVEEAVHTVIDSKITPEGHLRVHATHEIGKYYLMPLIADYRRGHPSVTVDLVLDNRQPDLVNEDFDMSISLSPPQGQQLVFRNIGATYSIMCAARSYLAQRALPKVPEDLVAHECLNPLEDAASAPDIWCFQGPYGPVNVYLPPSSFHLNTRDAIIDAVRAGLGIGCVPAFMAAQYLNSEELLRVLPDYHLESCGIYASYPEHLSKDVCARSWINYLSTHLPKRLAVGLHPLPA
jgi:DNA-binding transcriptional LysR family regulator